MSEQMGRVVKILFSFASTWLKKIEQSMKADIWHNHETNTNKTHTVSYDFNCWTMFYVV